MLDRDVCRADVREHLQRSQGVQVTGGDVDTVGSQSRFDELPTDVHESIQVIPVV